MSDFFLIFVIAKMEWSPDNTACEIPLKSIKDAAAGYIITSK